MPIVPQAKAAVKATYSAEEIAEHRQDLTETIREAIAELALPYFQASLEREVTEQLGRKKYQRRATIEHAAGVLNCPVCGSNDCRHFYRDGHYQRSLGTLWADLPLQIPRVESLCGQAPGREFKTFSQNRHFWSDVDGRLIELTALAVALRPVTALLGRHQRGVSIATAQRRIGRVGRLSEKEMSQPLTTGSAVIVLDGVWVAKMMPTGRLKKDKRGRQRQEKRGRKIPVLRALGIDPVIGQKTVLAWVQGSQEDAESWQKLLELLQKRGVSYEQGLRLFIHDGSAGLELAFEIVQFPGVKRQRCVFHKLRNVLRAIVGKPKMSREQKREWVKPILQEAAAIYQAADAAEARQRLAAFAQKWRSVEPDATATLEREFEMTLTFYAVQAEALQETDQSWPMKYLRTTSALERQNETCRAKCRQARAFWSTAGLDAAFYLRSHAYPALADAYDDDVLSHLAIAIWLT